MGFLVLTVFWKAWNICLLEHLVCLSVGMIGVWALDLSVCGNIWVCESLVIFSLSVCRYSWFLCLWERWVCLSDWCGNSWFVCLWKLMICLSVRMFDLSVCSNIGFSVDGEPGFVCLWECLVCTSVGTLASSVWRLMWGSLFICL
jgi:hypothetical protein